MIIRIPANRNEASKFKYSSLYYLNSSIQPYRSKVILKSTSGTFWHKNSMVSSLFSFAFNHIKNLNSHKYKKHQNFKNNEIGSGL